jgi:hypothetical protein
MRPQRKSDVYEKVPAVAFNSGDIVHFTMMEQDYDPNPLVYTDTGEIVPTPNKVDIGNGMVAHVKGRYGLVVYVMEGPFMTVAPIYTLGGRGLERVPVGQHNQYANIRMELDIDYKKQVTAVPDEWTLVVEQPPQDNAYPTTWRAHPKAVVRWANPHQRLFDTRISKVGRLIPASIDKMSKLFVAYQMYATTRPEERPKSVHLARFPWLSGRKPGDTRTKDNLLGIPPHVMDPRDRADAQVQRVLQRIKDLNKAIGESQARLAKSRVSKKRGLDFLEDAKADDKPALNLKLPSKDKKKDSEPEGRQVNPDTDKAQDDTGKR